MLVKALKRYLVYIAGVMFVLMLIVPAVQAGTVQIPKGKEVKVKFAQGMKVSSGELAPGVPLLISLAEPITLGDKTIVEEGAQGTAKVVEVKKSGRGGKPGYIKVEFVDLNSKGEYVSPKNEKIKLEGFQEGKGKGKKTLSYLFIFGLFIKGGQGEIDTGQVYTAKVADNIILQSPD